jgi:hypothetical protein
MLYAGPLHARSLPSSSNSVSVLFAGRLGSTTRQVPSSPSSYDRWVVHASGCDEDILLGTAGHAQVMRGQAGPHCSRRKPWVEGFVCGAVGSCWLTDGCRCLQGPGGRTLGPVSRYSGPAARGWNKGLALDELCNLLTGGWQRLPYIWIQSITFPEQPRPSCRRAEVLGRRLHEKLFELERSSCLDSL